MFTASGSEHTFLIGHSRKITQKNAVKISHLRSISRAQKYEVVLKRWMQQMLVKIDRDKQGNLQSRGTTKEQ